MKLIGLVGLILFAMPRVAMATMNGAEMQVYCSKVPALMNAAQLPDPTTQQEANQKGKDTVDGGYCLGFLDGIASGMALETARAVAVCPPPGGFVVKDLWKTFTLFVLDHPEAAQQGASTAAARAILASYPCPAK